MCSFALFLNLYQLVSIRAQDPVASQEIKRIEKTSRVPGAGSAGAAADAPFAPLPPFLGDWLDSGDSLHLKNDNDHQINVWLSMVNDNQCIINR